MTGKIPVRIVQTEDMHGTKKISIMIDVAYYVDSGSDPERKLRKFKKLYLDMVARGKKLFYGASREGARHQSLPSSLYWSLGELLLRFNNAVENGYVITNYTEAVSRDFGLSKNYVRDLLIISKIFKKDEISDHVYFAYYLVLKKKRRELVRLGLFEKEKKRLGRLGRQNRLPGREQYRKELDDIVRKNS